MATVTVYCSSGGTSSDTTITNAKRAFDGNQGNFASIYYVWGQSSWSWNNAVFSCSALPAAAVVSKITEYIKYGTDRDSGYITMMAYVGNTSLNGFQHSFYSSTSTWGYETASKQLTYSGTTAALRSNGITIRTPNVNVSLEDGQYFYLYEVYFVITYTLPAQTVTASAGDGGSITPSGNVSVTYGGSKTFAISPSEGYLTEDVLVDGVSVGAVSSYTFTNVTTAHSITASFKRAFDASALFQRRRENWII